MAKTHNVGIIQFNPIVGDLEGNASKLIEHYQTLVSSGATLVVSSELAITGYPPEDLVLRKNFRKETMRITKMVAEQVGEVPLIFGTIWEEKQRIYNSACITINTEIEKLVHKHNLPNYGVFDEKRLFTAARPVEPIEINGQQVAILICEDTWDDNVTKHYTKQPELIISINASPVERDKPQRRLNIAKDRIRECSAPLVYVNQVGGQDELVFDGGSFILDKNGKLLYHAPFWGNAISTYKFGLSTTNANISVNPHEYMYHTTVTGLKDYVEKNKFGGVIIGFSGGIDSALTAAIAVDALGKERVKLVMMPSEHTSEESLKDAQECATLLDVKLDNIPINKAVTAFQEMLAEQFESTTPDITEENIQSRARGLTLMALSNKFGYMVLTTGNKSEMAVGYATLYGDMCGGFNALKDIYKTDVFELAKWRNTIGKTIPDNIITKPPTAELRPNQKDEDSLPPYEILDGILRLLIEERRSAEYIIKQGYDAQTVHHVTALVIGTEYKRRQAPPGVKTTNLAFGRDRRYPITNRFTF